MNVVHQLIIECLRAEFELRKRAFHASRRKIGKIMKKHGVVSNYTVAQYKPFRTGSNESKETNILQRKFEQKQPFAVVVSDLTLHTCAKKMAL
ncbi:hypothetical protein [Paenibacillus kribbensis]|uniref:hypothetical protein n=1 Tax=Paenibacillus kribbensis TaxID=172713 RepID=UPI0009FC6C27|nr:hypothetical protein [Paenibacillus kribbensis]